jgi:alpha-L-fucosidase
MKKIKRMLLGPLAGCSLGMVALHADEAVSGSAGMDAMPTPLSSNAEPMQTGKFQPTWESLKQYQAPEWYRDAKFGIWAHWGPQCEPEDGDWYARNMYIQGTRQYNDHLKTYGHPSIFGFKDIIHIWKAENWDPEKLVALYKDAGAKFFVALANHHDNFDNYDSKYQPWNSVALGPQKDIIGGWAKAARDNGLPFGVTVHAAHAWSFYEPAQGSDKTGDKAGVPYDGKLTKEQGKGQWWDGLDPQDLYAQNHVPTNKLVWDWNARQGSSVPDAAYCEKFYNRTLDLVNKYHPDLLYFDDTVLPLYPISDVGLKIAAHYYNSNALWHNGQNQGVLLGKILNRQQRKCMIWDVERGASPQIEPLPWQSETCIGNWHYDRGLYDRHGYKNSDVVIRSLANVVSKNGIFLLNVPVRGDGTIDDQEIDIVKHIGAWMKVNGESIYATRPWKICGEGPAIDKPAAIQAQGFNEGQIHLGVDDIRYTTKGDVLYAIVLGWPTVPVVLHKLGKSSGTLTGSINTVEFLGSDEKIDWNQGDDALTIQPPVKKRFNEATVFKITLSKPANDGPNPYAEPAELPPIVSPDDVVVGVKETVKGKPNTLAVEGDFGGGRGTDERVANAIDDDPNTKYFNHAADGVNPPGINTGLVIRPKSGATVVTGIQFATANDVPERDPLAVTVEGSNDENAADAQGSGFALIYEGPTGLDPDPTRNKWGKVITFPNSTAYRTYRILVTKTCGANPDATQYSELKLIGTAVTH